VTLGTGLPAYIEPMGAKLANQMQPLSSSEGGQEIQLGTTPACKDYSTANYTLGDMSGRMVEHGKIKKRTSSFLPIYGPDINRIISEVLRISSRNSLSPRILTSVNL
jgi:hypothetical protein